jgi:hypothetical protein
MSLLQNSNAISSGSYDINNSLRFRSSASAYLSRTPTSAGNRQKFTLSVWIKLGELGTNKILLSSNTTAQQFRIYTDNTIGFGNSGVANYQSTGVLRDPSAWYHIVCKVDTTLASGKVVIYVNNTIYLTTDGGLSLNANTQFNNTVAHYIGRDTESPNAMFFDGYMAEYNFIDGQALTPSSFGETDTTTGSWKPKAYTSTYGTNGFYLKFSDIATTSGSNAGLGKDFSGNANYWTTNNISVTAGTTYDAMIDSPTLTSATVANYAVLNPLKMPAPASVSYTNGNLSVSVGNGNQTPALVTIYPSSGKWYWEVIWTSGSFARIGVQNTNVASTDFAADTAGWRWESNTGNIYNGSTLATVSTYATGDVLGFCLDLDAGKFYVSKNGTWQNSAVPESGTGAVATNIPTSTLMSPAVATGSLTSVFAFNAGQRPFSYTPPSGFNRLNTYNLPDSTIVKGNSYMDVALRTGTGTADGQSQVISSLAFTPDLVWNKARSNAFNHNLVDSVRGNDKILFSNLTDAETSVGTTGTQLQITTNGFTAIQRTSYQAVNQNGVTYVNWMWLAGAGSTSSGTGTGGITSVTQSVNTTAGFSIVTYTGSGSNGTVTHGLGVAPKMIIIKARGAAVNWTSYHEPLGNTAGLHLNTTGGSDVNSGFFNNTSPTSTTFSIGAGSTVNTSSGTYVAYCWAEIAGFSAFGSYTGNGSTNGPFVYTGFRPKFVLIKRTDSTSNWYLFDTARDTYNVMKDELLPNSSNAEADNSRWIDALSNGFKIRNDNASQINASGATMIYMAFAENPFKNANAR